MAVVAIITTEPKFNGFVCKQATGSCTRDRARRARMPTFGNLQPPIPDNDVIALEVGNTTPVCAIVEDDARIRHFLSLILCSAGVDALEFVNGAAFRIGDRATEMVFLGVNHDSNDCAQTLAMLGKRRYAGAVQLMGPAGAALEHLQRLGEQHGLRMLPALHKPFDAEAVRKILQRERLGDHPSATARVRLDEALRERWIEVWYQPKIDLLRKKLAGGEAFARVRHPAHGVLPPRAFVPGADQASLRKLAEITLVEALRTGLELSALGINLRIAVNMNMDSLVQVPVAEIVKEYRPDPERWAGLIVDVSEEEAVGHIARLTAVAKHLAAVNVKLAVDDFGRGVSSLLKVREIPFAELKIDRAFVAGCNRNPLNASICQTAIELAHSFGSLAVGMGIENAEEMATLAAMGCDLGQGFLFGQPMAEARFMTLLKQRATLFGPGMGA